MHGSCPYLGSHKMEEVVVEHGESYALCKLLCCFLQALCNLLLCSCYVYPMTHSYKDCRNHTRETSQVDSVHSERSSGEAEHVFSKDVSVFSKDVSLFSNDFSISQ